jgi:nicotinate-nucleotide pyrophosphorylase (carboxylating)
LVKRSSNAFLIIISLLTERILTGSISLAVDTLRSLSSFSIKIHVETQSLPEAVEALTAGADIVMLDNFTGEELADAVRALKEMKEKGFMGGRWLVEVSGGITDQNLKEYALDGV